MYFNKCLKTVINKFTQSDLSYGEAKEIVVAYSECLNGKYINYARLSDIFYRKSSFDLLTKYISVMHNIKYCHAIKFTIQLKKKYRMSYSELFLSAMHRELEEVLN